MPIASESTRAPAHKDRRRLDRVMDRLVGSIRRVRGLGWLRMPASRIGRMVGGVLLIGGGAVGFLPILGYWMIPLGVLLIAQDIPLLRRPVAAAAVRVERRWRRWRRGRQRR